MKIIVSIAFLFVCGLSFSQLIMERQVISCYALNVCNDFCLSSSAGQVETQTLTNGENVLTQGFEQPAGIRSLSIQLDVVYNPCTELYDAVVSSVSGCEESDSLSFLWNNFPGNNNANALPALTSLEITSSSGCMYQGNFDFLQMDIEMLPCELVFYSFLSPNGDGDNDLWTIKQIDNAKFAGNEVSIVNRWGTEVWSASGYNNGSVVWNGNSKNGEPLPDGTYFYIVKAAEIDYQGYIELMR